jgi:hypothetical protein
MLAVLAFSISVIYFEAKSVNVKGLVSSYYATGYLFLQEDIVLEFPQPGTKQEVLF